MQGVEGGGSVAQAQPSVSPEDIEGLWANDVMSYEFERTPGQ